MNVIKNIAAIATGERFTKAYTVAIAAGYAALVVANPAEAQTLRAGAENVFNTIYGLVGVLGAIAVLLTAINWKMGGLIGQDPKKYFINSLIGTGLAFGVVAIVQAIKDWFGSSGGVSGL